MKLRTQSPETLAQVVATPDNSTGIETRTESSITLTINRNSVERAGYVFVGERDGGDVYLDMISQTITSIPYRNSA